MDETKLYSWFLGPKAENADLFEKLLLEALRDCVFWRRNFHPEDDILITEKVKRDGEFQSSFALIQQEFLTLLANLKRDIPFYSPRYIGHMLGDQLLPAVLAYFAAMLHNPNNVSLEASPITTKYELEVAGQLARLMGYAGTTWGHITSGGTLANFESLWVARNLKFLPFALRSAAIQLELGDLEMRLPDGRRVNLPEIDDNWILANIEAGEALRLRAELYSQVQARFPGKDPFDIRCRIDEIILRHSISGKGIQRFFEEMRGERLAPAVILAPSTAHYSMQKCVEALGIGKSQLEMIPVNSHFRADTGALRAKLQGFAAERRPVIALVSVLGTTEEGAIDSVDRAVEIQSEMKRQGLSLYHHCDAAWGGYVRTLFFDEHGAKVETPSGIRTLTQSWPTDDIFAAYNAVSKCDSVTIDPHKLGYIPYPCGAVVFQHEAVKELITTEAPYIFDDHEKRERPFIGRHIIEGSKPGASAAACWFAHRIVPLNQSGYGMLIGKSIQSTQELCYRLAKELGPALEREGIRLHILADPPDGNIFCFIVNRAGNSSLVEMNRLNKAIYDEMKFNSESVIQRHNFIISNTSLTYEQYGGSTGDGTNCLDPHFRAVGIAPDQFRKVGSMRVLRCTVMSPWLAVSRGGNPDYEVAFTENLRETILRCNERLRASEPLIAANR